MLKRDHLAQPMRITLEGFNVKLCYKEYDVKLYKYIGLYIWRTILRQSNIERNYHIASIPTAQHLSTNVQIS